LANHIFRLRCLSSHIARKFKHRADSPQNRRAFVGLVKSQSSRFVVTTLRFRGAVSGSVPYRCVLSLLRKAVLIKSVWAAADSRLCCVRWLTSVLCFVVVNVVQCKVVVFKYQRRVFAQ
jgi:hypothetical protein